MQWLSGFARCLTSENASLDFVTLDFSPDTTLDSGFAKAIIDVVSYRSTEMDIKETEYLVDHGVIHISRLVPSENINEMAISDADRFEMLPLAANSTFEALPYEEKLFFKDDFRASDALKEGHIGAQIQAIGLGSNVWRLLAINPWFNADIDQISSLFSN